MTAESAATVIIAVVATSAAWYIALSAMLTRLHSRYRREINHLTFAAWKSGRDGNTMPPITF